MNWSIFKLQEIFLILILIFVAFPPVPNALAQEYIVGEKKVAPSGIDWNTLCIDLSQMNILLQTCNQLVNSNGTLTPTGNVTMGCIKSIMSLGIGAIHRGTSPASAVFGLGLLAQPTGCGNTVNMNEIKSLNQFRFLTQAFNLH